jgi:dTDP-4-dehydrorhamnose reductase
VVVVGRGWIGQKMGKLLGVEPVPHSFFNFKNTPWVINCAGVTGDPNVDACENQIAETMDGNARFPLRLYEYAQKIGARFAHFSSGCLYQGGPHKADDPPNFFGSAYSVSKIASDQILKSRALVFRIRMPFCAGDHPKNLLTKLRHYAETGKLWDGYNSLSHVDEMCSIAADLIGQNAQGAFNLVNEGAISTREIVEIMGLRAHPVLSWYSDDDFAAVTVAKRSECQLIPSVPTRPVREALMACIEQREAA